VSIIPENFRLWGVEFVLRGQFRLQMIGALWTETSYPSFVYPQLRAGNLYIQVDVFREGLKLGALARGDCRTYP